MRNKIEDDIDLADKENIEEENIKEDLNIKENSLEDRMSSSGDKEEEIEED